MPKTPRTIVEIVNAIYISIFFPFSTVHDRNQSIIKAPESRPYKISPKNPDISEAMGERIHTNITNPKTMQITTESIRKTTIAASTRIVKSNVSTTLSAIPTILQETPTFKNGDLCFLVLVMIANTIPTRAKTKPKKVKIRFPQRRQDKSPLVSVMIE